MGLVKTRRLAAMHKQERAIRLCQGYGGLKAGLEFRQVKVTPSVPSRHPLPPHYVKGGGNPSGK